MKKLKTLCTLILFVLFAKGTIAQYSPYVGYVPTITADRRVDWHNVGDKEKPTYYNVIFNVLNYGAVPNDGSDDRQAIQNTIDSAKNYLSANPGFYAAVYLTAAKSNILKTGEFPY
jgi:hypothetical protein